jgi:hypothetical protein
MRTLAMHLADRPGSVGDQPRATAPDDVPDRTDGPEFRQRLMAAACSGDWLAAEAACRNESRLQIIRYLGHAFRTVRR